MERTSSNRPVGTTRTSTIAAAAASVLCFFVSMSAQAQSVLVPAGTTMEIELAQGVNTEKAHVGDRVDGRLASDVMVDGWAAVQSGARVRGSVTEVVSGEDKIGGRPVLELTFNTLTTRDGHTVGIDARTQRKGDGETGEDAAKVAGGAVAGALIGNEVNDDKGAVVGGVLGAAAGAAAAKNTGDDVKIAAGKVVRAKTKMAFRVER